MKTLTLTDHEFELVKMAVSVQNDILNDTMLDNVSVNLYPTDDRPTVLTSEKAKLVREELELVFQNVRILAGLTSKLGIEVRDNGYSK